MSNLAERIAQATKPVFDKHHAQSRLDAEQLEKWKTYEGVHCMVYIIDKINPQWDDLQKKFDAAPGQRKIIGLELKDFTEDQHKFLKQMDSEKVHYVIQMLDQHYSGLLRFQRVTYHNKAVSVRLIRL